MTHPDVLVEGLRCAPGAPFFRWLVLQLREVLDVRYAFVGEFTSDDATRVHILATSEDTDAIDLSPYSYEIDGTPVAEAPDGDGFHFVASSARERFPSVPIYAALGIEGIACLRLADDQGRPLGLLCVLDTKPFASPDRVRSVLLDFRARAGGDLELRRVQRERELLTKAATVGRSSDALPQIVEHLARTLAVRCAFVSEVLDDPPTRARTLAMWDQGALTPNVEYTLRGTPCELVYEREVVFHPRDLQTLYADDPFLRTIGAQAYLGAALHDRHGRPLGHVGVLHDRPLHEGLARAPLFHVLALLASKELERRGAAPQRGLAAGEVAHDFNNMLAGILAHSGLALDELAAPDAVRARLEAIQSTARRASDLARDMLDAPDADADELVDLGPLVRETAALLGPAIPPNVRLHLDVEAALPLVSGRPTRLRQIVMNLLVNASEAVGRRAGHVRVHVARIGAPGAAAGVVLSVSDTGSGMSAELLPRIFEPRFTTKLGGRGVGLAIVRKLVDAHHATIDVESTPHRGARFTVRFPAADAAAAPPPSGATRHPSRPLARALRVLLVDDDEGVRVTTGHMLRRLGCEATLAADGETALGALGGTEPPPDLLFLDMAMPGMSGEELARTVRERLPALPIVVMSGYATQDLTRRLGQHGGMHFLQKPFGLEALRRCLEALDPLRAPGDPPADPKRALA